MEFRIVIEFLESHADFLNQCSKIGAGYSLLAVLCFSFPEFQNVIDEIEQPLGTGVDAGNLLVGENRQALVFHQIFQRTEDEGERCAKFMSDIGKEAQSLLIDFLIFLAFPPGLGQGIAQQELFPVGTQKVAQDA